MGPYRGIGAIYQFSTSRNDDFVRNYYEALDNEILNNIIHIIDEIRFIYEMFITTQAEMSVVDAAIFMKNYKNLLAACIGPIGMTFSLIGNSLKQHAIRQSEGQQFQNPRNMLILSSAYDVYWENVKALEKNNLVKEIDKGFTTDEHLRGDDLGISLDLNKIKSYKENTGFAVL